MIDMTETERLIIVSGLACAAANAPPDIGTEPDRHYYKNVSVSADRGRYIALRIINDPDHFQEVYESWCAFCHMPILVFRTLEGLGDE
jgi:hypothetical protein